MIPRPILTVLVLLLPVLIVAFAALMGGSALAQAMQDEPGAKVLRWIGVGTLLLTVVDLILLVGALGLRALVDDDRRPRSGD